MLLEKSTSPLHDSARPTRLSAQVPRALAGLAPTFLPAHRSRRRLLQRFSHGKQIPWRNHAFPLLALLLFVAATSVNWTPNDEELKWLQAPAVNGHGTTLTAVLDAPIRDDKNLLWCATMQMAWDRAGLGIGTPILLEPSAKLADALNRQSFDPRWLDAKATFITGGRVNAGVMKEIDSGARALSNKGSKLLKHLEPGLGNDDLVFFAMLHKQLSFEQPFGRLGKFPLGGHQVPCFGFTPDQNDTEALHQQVKVHSYHSKDDFVIELLTQDNAEQLVLARVPSPLTTLQKASAGVVGQLQAAPPAALGHDLLMVPQIVADEIARFSELEGRRVKSHPDLILRQALQSISFQMDEAGVKLSSEAAISFGCSAAPAHVEPRLLILKPPFLLLMKRRDAPQPYFVAWLGNADLLRAK